MSLALFPLAASVISADLESRSYQTAPGATMQEITQSRTNTLPFSATVSFDLDSDPPSLTATIYNFVLERGAPFTLNVQSDTFYKLANGAYRFDGDLIPDTQYFFSWTFSTNASGQLLWSGPAGWGGGHIWMLDISNVPIIPVAKLDVESAGPQITLSWASADTGYTLEQSTSLQSPVWTPVAKPPTTIGNRFSVTIDVDSTTAFFRLKN